MNDVLPQVAFAAVLGGEHDVERELVGGNPLPVLNAGDGEAADHVVMLDALARRHRTRPAVEHIGAARSDELLD